MPSLEEQFEQAFMEIPFDESGKHLLAAEAVTECVVSGESVTITLDLPQDEQRRQSISEQVEARVGRIEGISTVTIRMSDQAGNGGQGTPGEQPHEGVPRAPQRPQRQTYLQEYDAVVAISSGKGGVGKSTVAVNLAITLAKMGNQVSLFDSDIYGPSLPIMMGMRTTKPKMEENTIIPLEKYGVTSLSIGNLVEEAAATIWRGPIVHQVIDQLLRDTKWPGGDFMIIDLPPGTGDAQLTLTQVLEITGAVIVSTPQDVALLDALKGVAMFQKVDVPILGLIENMSTFICPNCQHETPIFDTGNAQRAGGQHNIPFLGRIPIELAIREGGDNGAPVASAAEETPITKAFREIAEGLINQINDL
jgi:ATP-binding protein involved in chromosome partitioning